MHCKINRGFTLLELLVVVLIIGILAAVALPQYQKAVLKSRYSAMMPIGKAIADSNEVYYMEHGSYASSPTALDVAGESTKYPDGTQVSMPTENEALSYVLVTNDNVSNARYVVYQKHSENFADTTMCEAGDDRTNELCQALGGQPLPEGMSGNSQGDDYTAYLLSGQPRSEDSFATANDDENANSGNNTSSGLDDETLAKLQAQVDNCPSNSTCFINEKNGTVTRCNNQVAKMEGSECVPTGTGFYYKYEYNADGKFVERYACRIMSSETCTQSTADFTNYNSDGSYKGKSLECNGGIITSERICQNGQYSSGTDTISSSDQSNVSSNYCVASSIGSDGECGTYYKMVATSSDNKHGLTRTCTDISNTTCNSYINTRAWAYDANNNYTEIACANTLDDGTCSGYQFRKNNRWTLCTDENTINWETATCS